MIQNIRTKLNSRYYMLRWSYKHTQVETIKWNCSLLNYSQNNSEIRGLIRWCCYFIIIPSFVWQNVDDHLQLISTTRSNNLCIFINIFLLFSSRYFSLVYQLLCLFVCKLVNWLFLSWVKLVLFSYFNL